MAGTFAGDPHDVGSGNRKGVEDDEVLPVLVECDSIGDGAEASVEDGFRQPGRLVGVAALVAPRPVLQRPRLMAHAPGVLVVEQALS